MCSKERKTGKLKIPWNHQAVMLFCGLRGAVAFALAMDLRTMTPNGPEILTTTIAIVLLTIVLLGGLTTPVLKLCNIPTGVPDETVRPESISQSDNLWQKLDKKYVYLEIVNYSKIQLAYT